jgi:hypothetical protein
VLPTLWRQLDQGHPVAYLDGDVDMAGPDEVGNAYVPAARDRVLEEVALLVEAGGRVKARNAEPIRVPCLLRRASHQPEEKSQNRRGRELSLCQPGRRIGVPGGENTNWWILA